MKHKKHFSGMGHIILIGLVLIAIGIVFKLIETYLAGKFGEHVAWQTFGLELLNHATVAFFSVAVLGFILETRHFYEYFHTLIVETIIDKRFIADLQSDKLKQLKKKCLETFFKIDELDKEDGFYNFYLDKIEQHIGGPFREYTEALTTVEFSPGRNSFIATDDITYTCRKLGKVIQDSAGWTAEQDEIKRVIEFTITVMKGKTSATHSHKEGDKTLDPDLKKYEAGHGFTLLLKKYQDYDGLKIRVTTKFEVPLERPFSWTMPCLSHVFSGSICYPCELDIFVDSFGLDESALPKAKPTNQTGVRTYHFEHSSWLLPDDGFSYHFRQTPVRQTQQRQQLARQTPPPTTGT